MQYTLKANARLRNHQKTSDENSASFLRSFAHSNYCQTAIEKLINSETKTPRQSRSAHAFVFSPKTKQYGGHSFSFQEYLANILQSKCGSKQPKSKLFVMDKASRPPLNRLCLNFLAILKPSIQESITLDLCFMVRSLRGCLHRRRKILAPGRSWKAIQVFVGFTCRNFCACG